MSALTIFREIVRRTLTCPLYLGMLLALVVHTLWGQKSFIQDGVLVTELKSDSWLMKGLFKNTGGTCLGLGIILKSGMNEYEYPIVLKHEMVHVEQNEAGSVAGLALGIVMATIVGLVGGGLWGLLPFFLCWLTFPWAAYLSASLVAILRSEESSYRGNHMEEAARGVAGQEV